MIFSGQIPPIPGNIEQVSEVEEQNLNPHKLTLIHKTLEAAKLAMADCIVLNRTNTDFW